MKKNLFLMFGFGVALLLGSCSQNEVESNEGGMAAQSVVCFSAGSSAEATRTSMDPDGTFYWTSGDYVFVKKGSDYIPSDNAATSRVLRQNFYLLGTFDDPTYPVVYTGNGKNQASEATSVTIASVQQQDIANDATHIGTDGDCGNATATKTGTGSYTFDIVHRAAYLIITPREALPGDVKLQKVEVTTSGTDNLCGTYTFSENTASLKDEAVTPGTAGTMVTLNVGDWDVPEVATATVTEADMDNVRGYMVIQPGTHTLKFTYYVTVDGNPRQFEKNVTSREFKSGHYTNVKHILADGMFDGGHTNAVSDPNGEINDNALNWNFQYGYSYSQWGASDEYLNTYGTSAYDQIATSYTQVTASPWKDLPNANELYWYGMYGDPHWDSNTVWSPDGGLTNRTGGIWLKKRQNIAGFSSTADGGGVDMRTTYKQYTTYNVRRVGAPANTGDYFFLPALGFYLSGSLAAVGDHGDYWSSSPYPDNALAAYHLYFTRTYVMVRADYRDRGFVLTSDWFK